MRTLVSKTKANKANNDVRERAQNAGVYLWQIADGLGMCDSGLSRAMRKELPDDLKVEIFRIIDKLSSEESEDKQNEHL